MSKNEEIARLRMDLYRYYTLLKDIARNARVAEAQSPMSQKVALIEIASMAENHVMAYEKAYPHEKGRA